MNVELIMHKQGEQHDALVTQVVSASAPTIVAGRLSRLVLLMGCGLSACSITPPQPPQQVIEWHRPASWVTPQLASQSASQSNTTVSSLAVDTDNAATQQQKRADSKIEDLTHWWARFDDATLLDVIAAAQAVSPTVSVANARIAQAQATLTSADSRNMPQLDAVGSVTRSKTQAGFPVSTLAQVGLQASWEIDLFGRNKAAENASQARLDSAKASWHDARVSVAAETAGVYFGLKQCMVQQKILQAQASSLRNQARLVDLAVAAGVTAPIDAATAHAAAQNSQIQVTTGQSNCNAMLQSLASLSAIDVQTLKQKVATAPETDSKKAVFNISNIPAEVLNQRPDIFEAGKEIEASRADFTATEAARYPSIGLSGAIGRASYRAMGTTTDLNTWSIGPLSITVPIFDAGRRKANSLAAKAQYENAVVAFNATARNAVREVEDALEAAHSSELRLADAQKMQQHYDATLKAITARYTVGAASQIEVEQAKRAQLANQLAMVGINADKLQAFITLYRAVGGGWVADKNSGNSSSTSSNNESKR